MRKTVGFAAPDHKRQARNKVWQHPIRSLTRPLISAPRQRGDDECEKAGLLAPRSSYSPRLTAVSESPFGSCQQWHLRGFRRSLQRRNRLGFHPPRIVKMHRIRHPVPYSPMAVATGTLSRVNHSIWWFWSKNCTACSVLKIGGQAQLLTVFYRSSPSPNTPVAHHELVGSRAIFSTHSRNDQSPFTCVPDGHAIAAGGWHIHC